MEKDKDQAVADIVSVENENEDEQLRQQVLQLQEKLKIVTQEKNNEKDRASAREKEMDALSNTLRRQEQSAAIERDNLVRDYQGRINALVNGRLMDGVASSETESISVQNLQARGQPASQRNVQSNGQETEVQGTRDGQGRRYNTHANYEVPMPRQALFDGKATWESFFQPFEALAQACQWDNNEKLFRLTSCLRGEAAEYAFGQLPPEALRDFTQLEKALEARYKEKRTSSSYLAELENRKLQLKEKLADYVADIKKLVIKGYPTADAQTREKINVRHFLKGLTDQQMGVSVGMREPASIDEARQILEMYNSLRDEVKNTRVRAVQPANDSDQFVSEKRLREFGAEIKSCVGKKIDALAQKLDGSNKARASDIPSGSTDHNPGGNSGGGARPKKRQNIRCFSCNGENHIARNCPSKAERGEANNNNNSQGN